MVRLSVYCMAYENYQPLINSQLESNGNTDCHTIIAVHPHVWTLLSKVALERRKTGDDYANSLLKSYVLLHKDLELHDSDLIMEAHMSDRRTIFRLKPDVYDLLKQAALERGLSIDDFAELLLTCRISRFKLNIFVNKKLRDTFRSFSFSFIALAGISLVCILP